MRPISWRYDRLLADQTELTTALAERVQQLEAEVARLDGPPGGRAAVRIAVLHPQTAFVARRRRDAHRGAGAGAEGGGSRRRAGARSPASGIRRGSSRTRWRCGGRFDITESNGLKVDAVIALKFPAYLVQHERKIVWLIHQHRSAYELWDHPDFADLSLQEDGARSAT